MKHLFIVSVFLFSSHFLYPQTAPAVQWKKSFGGTKHDAALCIRQTSEGGYIAAGVSFSNDGNVSGHHGSLDSADSWITKLSSTGVLEWQKSLGGTGDDWTRSIQQTRDGGYILTGYSNSVNGDVSGNHGGYDCWVVKINSEGSLEWQKSLGGTSDDRANSVQQTSDGGYIIAAASSSADGDVIGHHGIDPNNDCWIVKLNSTGSIEWQKSLGGTNDDLGNSIQQTNDQGYIVGGMTRSDDGDVSGNHSFWQYDYWVIKLNSQGSIEWQNCLGGTDYENGQSVQQTTDGGYIMAGFSYSTDGDVSGHHASSAAADFWAVKLSSTGSIQWQKSMGGSFPDLAFSAGQTNDGGYITVGVSSSNNGDVIGKTGNYGNYWVVKTGTTGIIQWQKSLGSQTLYNSDEAYSVQQTSDSGYVIAGHGVDNSGDITDNHGSTDFWIVKLAPDVSNPVYTFTGTGNWDIPANWSGSVVPPSVVPAGTQIIIKPQPGGECILNVQVSVSNGASVWVVSGARFNALANLNILH